MVIFRLEDKNDPQNIQLVGAFAIFLNLLRSKYLKQFAKHLVKIACFTSGRGVLAKISNNLGFICIIFCHKYNRKRKR